MSYTKKQLENQRQELLQRIEAIEKEIAAIGDETLSLTPLHRQAPFRKWYTQEWQQLYTLNPAAYEWFNNHREATIDDYNSTHFSTQRIVLSE